VAGKLPRYVELLKFKTLSVGMRLWGAVAEVSARDLVVSLPHGLKGFVAPAECSDALAAQLATAGGETLSSDSDDNSDDEEHAPRAGTLPLPLRFLPTVNPAKPRWRRGASYVLTPPPPPLPARSLSAMHWRLNRTHPYTG
jgi:hypothetical protein